MQHTKPHKHHVALRVLMAVLIGFSATCGATSTFSSTASSKRREFRQEKDILPTDHSTCAGVAVNIIRDESPNIPTTQRTYHTEVSWMLQDAVTGEIKQRGASSKRDPFDSPTTKTMLSPGTFVLTLGSKTPYSKHERKQTTPEISYRVKVGDRVAGILTLNDDANMITKTFAETAFQSWSLTFSILPEDCDDRDNKDTHKEQLRTRALQNSDPMYPLKLVIVPDAFPQETNWTLFQVQGDDSTNPGALALFAEGVSEPDSMFVSPGKFALEITDALHDGLCCDFGMGRYQLDVNEQTVYADDGDFGSSTGLLEFELLANGTVVLPHTALPPDVITCPLKVWIQPDYFPDESEWFVYTETDGPIPVFAVLKTGTYESDSMWVVPGRYAFEMTDELGDGMCCDYGEGSFRVDVKNTTVVQGGEFGSTTGLWEFTVLDDCSVSTVVEDHLVESQEVKDAVPPPSAAPWGTPSWTPTRHVINLLQDDLNLLSEQELSDPTASPMEAPTRGPTSPPTRPPSRYPTRAPVFTPAPVPPTGAPVPFPTPDPTVPFPTADPTRNPTALPTTVPTLDPTANPSKDPTSRPTATPTDVPTAVPTVGPTAPPTTAPPTTAPTDTITFSSPYRLVFRILTSVPEFTDADREEVRRELEVYLTSFIEGALPALHNLEYTLESSHTFLEYVISDINLQFRTTLLAPADQPQPTRDEVDQLISFAFGGTSELFNGRARFIRQALSQTLSPDNPYKLTTSLEFHGPAQMRN